jgi:5-deoxy-D-glucuronate isomerase
MTSLHLTRGATAAGPFELVVTPERAGWGFSGLPILELDAGGAHAFDTHDATRSATVGTPSTLTDRPSAFGISTARTGGGM